MCMRACERVWELMLTEVSLAPSALFSPLLRLDCFLLCHFYDTKTHRNVKEGKKEVEQDAHRREQAHRPG